MKMLLIILLCMSNVITIINIITIIYLFSKKDKQDENIKDKQKRVHTAIKSSNYNNSFGNRGYDIYKNKNGLYEPQKPSRGIELKEE